jgi:hypothetical protein
MVAKVINKNELKGTFKIIFVILQTRKMREEVMLQKLSNSKEHEIIQ